MEPVWGPELFQKKYDIIKKQRPETLIVMSEKYCLQTEQEGIFIARFLVKLFCKH